MAIVTWVPWFLLGLSVGSVLAAGKDPWLEVPAEMPGLGERVDRVKEALMPLATAPSALDPVILERAIAGRRHLETTPRTGEASEPDEKILDRFFTGKYESALTALLGAGSRLALIRLLMRPHLEFLSGDWARARDHYRSFTEPSANPFLAWDHELARTMGALCEIRLMGSPEQGLIDLVDALGAPEKVPPGEAGLNLAWAYFLARRFPEALRACQTLYGSLENDPRLYHLYGQTLVASGRLDDARGAFTRAIDLGAHHPAPSLAYASVALELGLTREAVREMAATGVIHGEESPAGRDPWYDRTPADVLTMGATSHEARLGVVRAALEKVGGPWRGRALAAMGDLAVIEGKFEEAARWYRSSLEIDRMSVDTRLKAAAAILIAGDLESSFETSLEGVDLLVLDRVHEDQSRILGQYRPLMKALADAYALPAYAAATRLSKDPADGAAHRTLAAVHYVLHFHDKSLAQIAGWRAQAPGDERVGKLECFASWHRSRLIGEALSHTVMERSAASLERWTIGHPEPASEFLLARLLGKLGKPDDAASFLERALAHGAEDPESLHELASRAEAAGDMPRALDLYRRALGVSGRSRLASATWISYQKLKIRSPEGSR